MSSKNKASRAVLGPVPEDRGNYRWLNRRAQAGAGDGPARCWFVLSPFFYRYTPQWAVIAEVFMVLYATGFFPSQGKKQSPQLT